MSKNCCTFAPENETNPDGDPTVNRRSTDSQGLRHYKISTLLSPQRAKILLINYIIYLYIIYIQNLYFYGKSRNRFSN